MVIDENPRLVVAPSLSVPARQLAAVDHLARSIANYFWSPANVEQKDFAGAMLAVTEAINEACEGIEAPGVVEVAIPAPAGPTPDNWQRLLHGAIGQLGMGANLKPEPLAIITKAATGSLDRLMVVTDQTPKGDLHSFVVATWATKLPADAAVVMLDATGSAEDIEAATGMKVQDCTPDGHLEAVHPIRQVAKDITRETSPEVVANVVCGFLDAHPDIERLGIIGHSRHIKWLIKASTISEETKQRITKVCYFGQGPERASNDWHRVCDHILILGTPRANPGDLRRWLATGGRTEAAARSGDWGAKPWETSSGVVVEGTGYRDPDWHRAYVALSQAILWQSVGRGRSILPEGVPVTAFTTDATGFEVVAPPDALPTAERQTVEVARRTLSAIGDSYREKCPSRTVSTQALLDALESEGISRRAGKKRLAKCRESGALAQPRRGHWALPEKPPQFVQPPQASTTVAAALPEPSEPERVAAVSPEAPTTCITTETTFANAPAEALAEQGAVDVVGVDHLALEASGDPAVKEAAERFSGSVRRISEAEDPFRNRRTPGWKRQPGVCQCGHSDWREVSIHKGASRRMDCRHCDRFGWFSLWHGEPLLAPWQEPPEVVPLESIEASHALPAGIFGTEASDGWAGAVAAGVW